MDDYDAMWEETDLVLLDWDDPEPNEDLIYELRAGK